MNKKFGVWKWVAVLGWSALNLANVHAQALSSPPAAQRDHSMSMREVLYLVPFGTLPAGASEMLEKYVESRFNIPTQVTPRASLNRDFIDYQRGVQAIGEKLVLRMQALYPLPSGERHPLYLAVTSSDIFSAEHPEWLHVLALREPKGHYALISSARLDESFYARSPDPKLLQLRLKKMVARQVSVLLLNKPLNQDPTSVLFAGLKDVSDLDKMTQDF